VTQSNDTADSISSIISEVQSIINELVEDLGGSSLSDSSVKEILAQVANVFEVPLPSSSIFSPLTLTFCGTDCP
jgi:methyl-accepting chemotaxis protein